jgi:4-carboxymuconolactone decarboxylase
VSRLKPLLPADMTPAQISLRDSMLKVWKRAEGGPFDLWYKSPELGQRSHHLGAYCRWETKLEFDVLEIAIITTARHWSQAYEWATHVKNARDAGIGQDVIDAIEGGRPPVFTTVEQSMAHDVAREILETRKLSTETYGRAAAIFGEPALVELAAIIGWYTSLAIQMNIFDVGA